MAINRLSTHLMPWKPEAMFEREDPRPVTVERLKEAIEALSQDKRASPAEIRGGEEPSLEQLMSIVAHFQRLFDVSSVPGVFPRMTEIYMRLGETYNATNTMRDLLGLGKLSGLFCPCLIVCLSRTLGSPSVRPLNARTKQQQQQQQVFSHFLITRGILKSTSRLHKKVRVGIYNTEITTEHNLAGQPQESMLS